MKKNINIKILSTICILAILFVSNTFGVSAIGLEDSNGSYEFVGNSIVEFKGEIYVEDNGEDNAYYVDENVTWEDSDSRHGLQEGDVIGICKNISNSDNKISYSVHGEENTITEQTSCIRNSVKAKSSKSGDNITAQHIGYRDYQRYSGTNNLTGKQRVHAETLASISYTQNGCKKSQYIDSYSLARYELFGNVRVTSGKKWNKDYTFWSYANTDYLSDSIARDLQARTYWGTER